MSWRQEKLGNVVTLKRGYDLPESRRIPGEFPVVSSSGITGSHSEKKVDGPGVITGRYGTLGEVFYVEGPYWPLNTALYVQEFKGSHPRFVAYFLRALLRNMMSDKAAVPGVNRNDLHERIVRVPDPSTQERIAHTLAAYDDLIDNNRRRMELLEQAARLLYTEWFVRLRFPGFEHVRVIARVPDGWERTFVPDIIDIDPKTVVPRQGTKPFVEMSCLQTDSMIIEDPGLREGNSGSKFRNGDTLFARITPCLENGKTGFVNFLENGATAFGSTEFIVLRGRRVSPQFTYCLARTHEFRGKAIRSMIGSSGRQRVQASCFDELLVPLAPRTLLDQFQSIVEPVFEQIRCLMLTNRKLREARDLLLPRLMNGQITV